MNYGEITPEMQENINEYWEQVMWRNWIRKCMRVMFEK